MTEYSRFWDAADPVAEPYIYSADEFAQAHGRSNWRSGVLLGQDNELGVIPTGGAKSVAVATGQGYIRGYWYGSDAVETIVIADHAGVSRTDRIILRWTAATKTIVLATLLGVEGSTVPTALTQTAAVWEVPLAIVYVTNANLTVADVAEDREFAQPYSRTYQRNMNLIENGHCSGISTTEPWVTNNATLVDSNAQQFWGTRSFFLTTTAAGGYMRYVIPSEYLKARPYYVKAYVYVAGGTARLDVNGAGLTKDFPREQTSGAAAWVLLEGTFMADGTNDVNIDLIGVGNGDTFYADAIMVMEGGSYDLYVPNSAQAYQQKNVFVPCTAAYSAAADVARSNEQGFPFADAVETDGFGNWAIPYDYIDGSDIIIDAIVSYDGTAHGGESIRIQNQGSWAYYAECYNNSTFDSVVGDQAVDNACVVRFYERVTETLMDANDLVFLKFTRYGDHVNDDFTATVYFLGWVIYYYARENIA